MTETQIHRLCTTVRAISLAAHRFLRHGHSEKIYENALVHRMRKHGLHVRQQQPVAVFDEDGASLGDVFADLLVENVLIIRVKAVRHLVDEHSAQVLGFLRASRLEHAMLINFGSPIIQFKTCFLHETPDLAQIR